MKNRNLWKLVFFSTTSLLLTLPLGCGPAAGMYQGETLTFETPISAKSDLMEPEKKDLDLGADDSSNFFYPGFATPLAPWAPYGLFDYYLEPIPVAVPVSPAFALVDYVHPFYLDYYANPYFDDDDGLYFRPDDD